MSTPDPSSAVSVAVSRPLTATASAETPVTPANTVRTPPSQPPPAPPPPPPHRAIAPLHHHHPSHPFQQAHHPYAQSFPIRRPNSVTNPPHQQHQDPSALLYPFAPSGRGFPTRAGRPSSPSVVDPPVTGGNPGGYSPRVVFPYQQRPYGSTPLDPVLQFMRSAHTPIHQFPHLGSGPPAGSGPMRGIPHFLQPRVAPPPSSVVDNHELKNARSRDEAVVLVRDRKVRITDGASIYSLCRSWLRNGLHEGIQLQSSDAVKCLPKPLPVHVREKSLPKDQAEELTNEDKEDDEPVKDLSEKELLRRHVNRAKKIRARLRRERLRRIERYKARLALLLPSNSDQSRSD